MTYMIQNVDNAVSGGIQELGLGEVEMVSGARTYTNRQLIAITIENSVNLLLSGNTGAAEDLVKNVWDWIWDKPFYQG